MDGNMLFGLISQAHLRAHCASGENKVEKKTKAEKVENAQDSEIKKAATT